MKIVMMLKIIIGFMALAFGLIGLVLPVWPTTPFVLLAIGVFSSMPKMQQKILKINFFREYYESYTKGNKIRKRTVATSLSFLWVMLTISMVFVRVPFVMALLLVVGIAVTIHILLIARGKVKYRHE